jgi:serine/threonine protein phosphatase 1
MKSFGVARLEDIPDTYIRLLEAMPYLLVENDSVFVHAGLDMMTDDPLRDTDPLYLLWNTSRQVDRGKVGGRKLVTGHVIDCLDDIRVSLHTGNIRLDNGAFTNLQPDMGNLVALNFDTGDLIVQPWYDGEALY